MQIVSLMLKDFGPLRGSHRFSFSSVTRNVIVGHNGSGKTHILNLLATLAGNDHATQLCANMPIGKVKLCMQGGYNIEMSEILDESLIRDFKRTLGGARINFGLPEDKSNEYQHGCCNNVTFQRLMERYVIRHLDEKPMFDNPYYSCGGGDGFKQETRLSFLKSIENVPLLLESPEQHLHIMNQYRMGQMLDHEPGQVIYTTHSPEMVNGTENVIDLSL